MVWNMYSMDQVPILIVIVLYRVWCVRRVLNVWCVRRVLNVWCVRRVLNVWWLQAVHAVNMTHDSAHAQMDVKF